MQARPQPGHGLGRVQAVGRGHGEDIGGRAMGEIIIQRSKKRHSDKLGGQAGAQLLAHVNQGHESGLGVAADQRGVAAANVAHAANGEAHG